MLKIKFILNNKSLTYNNKKDLLILINSKKFYSSLSSDDDNYCESKDESFESFHFFFKTFISSRNKTDHNLIYEHCNDYFLTHLAENRFISHEMQKKLLTKNLAVKHFLAYNSNLKTDVIESLMELNSPVIFSKLSHNNFLPSPLKEKARKKFKYLYQSKKHKEEQKCLRKLLKYSYYYS